VTAHVGLLDASGTALRSRSWIADPGVAIPEGATAVHGITTAHARTGAPQPRSSQRSRLHCAICSPPASRSSPTTRRSTSPAEVRGAPPRHPAHRRTSPVVDPLVLDKAHDRFRKGKRTLEVVAAHYAVALVGAHDAAADAIAAGRVAQALARRFALAGPVELHTQQIAWARAQAESLTEYFVRMGRSTRFPPRRSWPIR
jgi:DNA polymerase-3 subunit epsilon